MSVLTPSINLLSLSGISKGLFLRNIEPLVDTQIYSFSAFRDKFSCTDNVFFSVNRYVVCALISTVTFFVIT